LRARRRWTASKTDHSLGGAAVEVVDVQDYPVDLGQAVQGLFFAVGLCVVCYLDFAPGLLCPIFDSLIFASLIPSFFRLFLFRNPEHMIRPDLETLVMG
jgi:hypothetical protein